MGGITTTLVTTVVISDLVEYDRFLRGHGLEHYTLFLVNSSIYIGISFAVRGEMMLYKLKNLEERFKAEYSDKYIYGFDDNWEWEELFHDTGE